MSKLSHRENEVARMVCSGALNKEIASFLGIQEGTVKNHLAIMFNKFGVRNRVEFAVQYINQVDFGIGKQTMEIISALEEKRMTVSGQLDTLHESIVDLDNQINYARDLISAYRERNPSQPNE